MSGCRHQAEGEKQILRRFAPQNDNVFLIEPICLSQAPVRLWSGRRAKWPAPCGNFPRGAVTSAKEPVSRILSCAVIPLDAASPRTFISDLPGGFGTCLNRLSRIGPIRLAARFYRPWASPSLFGLAPCGVYPAPGFTVGAVRSYRTFSPLPRRAGSKLLAGCLRRPGKGRKRVAEAVFSLWHWPSRSLDAAIPDVIRHTALRSSDFPPPMHSPALRLAKLRQRPHGSLAIVILPAFEISELALNLSAATPGGLLLSLRAPLRRSCCSICVGRRSRPPAL
jgi:hypothetical protein